MSWPEFYYATEGHFDELRQKLGIPEQKDMSPPSDKKRQQIKQESEEWMKFFKRPTLKAEKL